jgi:hypothetical protein
MASDAKLYHWMSKLSCKREEYEKEFGREPYIHNSADSLSFEIDWANMEDQQFPNSKSYQTHTSFPMCTFVCKKHDDPVLHSFSTEQHKTNEDHTYHASVEQRGPFSSESLRKATCPTEVTHREILSPCVQLVHEIHLQRGSTGTDDIALSENPPFQANSINEVDQNEYTIYRQRIRYEAIKKELFDDSTLETIDQETIDDYDNEYMYGDDFLVNSDALDKIGCQVASLWSCIPNMSKLFVPSLREAELVEDDSISEGGTQDASVNDIEEVSDHSDDKHADFIRLPDKRGSSPYIWDKTCDDSSQLDDSVEHEESSYSGSYMDQSHIYLMMTNVRQERSAISQCKFEKTKEVTHSNILKESDTTRSVGLHSGKLVQTTAESNKSPTFIDTWWGHNPFATSKFPDSSQTWMRHFQNQPNSNKRPELETDHLQKRWLNLISQTLKGDTGSRMTSSQSNQMEQREAAKAALQRIAKKKNND